MLGDHGAGAIGEGGSGAKADDVIDEVALLLAERPEPRVLVLDDYHVITAPEVLRTVGVLLERLPAQAHLVISTRQDPILPLARLRAHGELLELRADALRFTNEEARVFFSDRMDVKPFPQLGSDRVRRQSRRSRGNSWIEGRGHCSKRR